MSLKEFKRALLSCSSMTRLPFSTVESSNTQDRKPPKSNLKHQIASIERLAENLECTPSGESLPSLPVLPLPPRRSRNIHEPGHLARTGSSDSQSLVECGQHSTREEQSEENSTLDCRRRPVKRTRLSSYAGLLTGNVFDELKSSPSKLSELMPADLGGSEDKVIPEAPINAAVNGEISQIQSQRVHGHNKQKSHADDDLEEEGPAPPSVGDSEAGLFIQSEIDGLYEPLVLWPPDWDASKQGGDVVQVPASVNSRLLEHQRVGVKFLYSLYREDRGGVLGDDMGLGKTIQVIAFLAAVLQSRIRNGEKDHQMQKPVLIICPTSVLRNWEQEFHAWGAFEVAIYHGIHRELVVNRLRSSKLEIVLTSFDTFRIHGDCLCIIDWNCVIIDEAHRLKNDKSDLYKVCAKIPTRKRYGLTGTIMQNKIMDLFNVFDWAAPGCLGTREHFREFYDEPLKQGQRTSAPETFIKVAKERRLHLGNVLQRYLLRREKHETIGHLMLGKEDNVIFCAMSPLQQKVYKRLLASPDFECLIKKDEPCSCGSPLTRAECCYRIAPNGIIWPYLHRENPDGCDSCPYCLILPCLTKLQQVSNHLELIKPNLKDDVEKQKKDELLSENILGEDAGLVGGTTQDESFLGLSDSQHCGKMKALELLLAHWVTHGDKVLLFSYSVRMLDILDKFIIRKGYCFSRLDGSTPMNLRQSLVDDFNRSPSKQVKCHTLFESLKFKVFLISTRAGGLGLNLVSANRVVIFDPNWNPAQDLQAQDRSFRYGQRRHVTVYRLLAAGSLEELVYSRQIYKQQLFNIAVSGNLEKRYFEGVQDSKGNKGELFGISNLFRDLSDKVFTSEIIDRYDKRTASFHGKRSPGNSRTETDGNLAKEEIAGGVNDHSMGGAVVQETNRADKVAKQNFRVKRTSEDELACVLKNAGVLYAHRNEDVVNYQARDKKDDDVIKSVVSKDSSIKKENKVRVGRVSKKFVKKTEVNKASSLKPDLGKEEQFAMLAKIKGMDMTAFCEWLLSASEVEREKLLLDFKNGQKTI